MSSSSERMINEELQAREDLLVQQFYNKLNTDNERAARAARRKLKPNLNKEWVDKYRLQMNQSSE